MRLDHISIKWKLFLYLFIFTVVLLALLWFYQTVFLDDFYKAIKTQSMKASAHSIAENIDNRNLQTLIDRITRQREIDIRIVDSNFNDLYLPNTDNRPMDMRLYNLDLQQCYMNALNNNNEYLELLQSDGHGRNKYENNNFRGNVPEKGILDMQNLLYVQLVKTADGSGVMLLLNTAITPMGATVDTLRVQLISLTGIMFIMSILLAFYMSRSISKPIIKINNSAKEFAKGNYEATFDGRGYREIAELNETLNYAARELSKTDSLRRELIANISHDLRTPLTLITGYSEVMRDLPGENTPENIQVIIDEAKHLTSLVNDVLDISKLQSGTQELSVSEFNLSQSIRNILGRYSKLIGQDGYNITFECERDIFVKADEVKISQVLYNLINNAVTHTGVTKSVRVCQKLNKERVRIEITDTGEGISPENLPYIWDRYYKVEKTHKRAKIGTGLGLSIVKSVLEMHGTKYGVESVPGQGSTFWFELEVI